MTAKSHNNGHKIHYQSYPTLGISKWVYSDTREVVNDNNPRPCKRCGELPTKEGYDACTGFVPGAESVCCGHGVSKPIMLMETVGGG